MDANLRPLGNTGTGMEACLRGLRLRGFAPETVLDIGAARGEWTAMALRYWPRARFFLAEVLEEWRPDLERLRRAEPNVDFEIVGIGDQAGSATVGITQALYDSSLAYAGTRSRSTAVVTLDHLFRQGRFEQPQFLKLDVQGYERRVLAGAGKVLEACELVLLEVQFIRFCPDMWLVHECIAWMAARGFVPYEFVDVLRRPLDGAMGQCDILFARAGHWLRADARWS